MFPKSVNNRSGSLTQPNNNRMPSYIPMASVHANNLNGRLHDPIGYISSERAQAFAAMPAMPVPIGVFMDMNHPPPPFHHGGHHGMLQQGELGGNPSNNMLTGYGQPSLLGQGNTDGLSPYTQSTPQYTQHMSISQSFVPSTQGMSQVKLIDCFLFL